ncbi:hypothetical protein Vadar_011276 [Vaccinium darrowii]|uniref:Uncharacterized protein n=1 Tax=Vaccinium darrowii TaxID=229202 RepID=A0ACB7XGV6_9ERIC|nr:hypothetical protein Vadar_011276 [Vaccinium darrowii]
MAKSSGIIVNSFEAIHPRVIQVISDGLCVPNGRTPPVYCWPLIVDGGGCDDNECLSWLDSQPSRSVVFLCFGSRGLFKAEQLKEIATGLENSGYRFLWVVRNPPMEDQAKRILAPSKPELDALLPEGFMDRTKDRGLVVKSWCPKGAVLSHASVGGFVTHCGWSSVQEVVRGGVPMLAWPLFAEQRLNGVVMVEEMKLALVLDGSEDGFVR